MRDILFRGKRKDNGEWIEGSVIHIGNRAFICKEGIAEVGAGYKVVSTVKEENGTFLNIRRISEIIPETVGRYTGLKNKNGTKIFEGDVVRDSADNMGIISWDKDTAQFVIRIDDFIDISKFVVKPDNFVYRIDNNYSTELEVIGNIHDNPELLEVE